MTPKSGRAIAWISFSLGIGVSIAGNIGHAASDGMKPGEWAGAAFWPLALMLTIEILTRVRWQPEARWIVARIAGLVLVAMVAAVLSYRHLAGLMLYWGEDRLNAYLGPLAVDGLMLVAATALLSISKERPQRAETFFRPHVFQWPKPIGPKPLHQQAKDSRSDAEVLQQFADARGAAVTVDEVTPAETTYDPQLHVVSSVSGADAEEAARQAWIKSEGQLSVREVAKIMGTSASTAHRRINDQWRIQR